MLQPIPLGEFVALAIALDFPLRGLQSKVTKFLDDQVGESLLGELLQTLIRRTQAVHFQAPPGKGRR